VEDRVEATLKSHQLLIVRVDYLIDFDTRKDRPYFYNVDTQFLSFLFPEHGLVFDLVTRSAAHVPVSADDFRPCTFCIHQSRP
jgi:hypothetical protein